MMDEPTTRAQLATMEVVSQMMLALADRKILPRDFLVALCRAAAERLEPLEEGSLLDPLQEHWHVTAAFLLEGTT